MKSKAARGTNATETPEGLLRGCFTRERLHFFSLSSLSLSSLKIIINLFEMQASPRDPFFSDVAIKSRSARATGLSWRPREQKQASFPSRACSRGAHRESSTRVSVRVYRELSRGEDPFPKARSPTKRYTRDHRPSSNGRRMREAKEKKTPLRAYQLPSLARRRGRVSLGRDRFSGDRNSRRDGGSHGYSRHGS